MRKFLAFFFTSIVTVFVSAILLDDGLHLELLGGTSIIVVPLILFYGVPISVLSDKATAELTGVLRLVCSFLIHSFFGVAFAFILVAFDFRFFDYSDPIDRFIFLCATISSVVFWLIDELIRYRHKKGGKSVKWIRTGVIIFISVSTLIVIVSLTNAISETLQVKNAAREFLENIIEENYSEAFEHVFYHDQSAEYEPTITYEQAKEEWITRVHELKKSGTYIKSFDSLSTSLNDRWAYGNVTIAVVENGKELVYERASISFQKRNDQWKIAGIHVGNDETSWVRTIDGRVGKQSSIK